MLLLLLLFGLVLVSGEVEMHIFSVCRKEVFFIEAAQTQITSVISQRKYLHNI